ncbi:uncharacterized protein PHALS_01588 [Plasmopara halstedii]|uniref:Uncharacterized protein n=1 Tax=Plasmopara halstedii TaxID=4781 RepID=A0A0P1AUX6_PLAHL|nr:uncharacterized protein PHALS_01588 [Plasmopara halstedii]CEG45280.1 hypothetical protein PHALS_01588 [Plasmopara halstedii]|eukprot:XP_024581649.1 hypothetical protein PHALS_01588 [Plasmopara halstedii]
MLGRLVAQRSIIDLGSVWSLDQYRSPCNHGKLKPDGWDPKTRGLGVYQTKSWKAWGNCRVQALLGTDNIVKHLAYSNLPSGKSQYSQAWSLTGGTCPHPCIIPHKPFQGAGWDYSLCTFPVGVLDLVCSSTGLSSDDHLSPQDA